MERVQSTKRDVVVASPPQPPTVKGKMRDYRFAMAYLREPNATKAAIACGLAPKSATSEGNKLLRKPNVQAILANARNRLEQTTNITVESLLKELGKVAFATMEDYWRIDEDGNPHVDLSMLTPEQWAAIGEISVEEFMDGPKGKERPVKRTKFKLHDKLGAIDKAMRHLGGYGRDTGAGSDAVVDRTENTVVYTLNIGTANIQVNAGKEPPAPKTIEG